MSKRPFSRSSAASQSLKAAFDYFVHPEPNSGCWLWTGPIFALRGGYGCFTMRRAGIVQWRAHRVAWKLHCSEIGPSDHVLHRCDTPLCVNPSHLFLGDQPVNMADKVRKVRQDRGQKHGMHKLTEAEAVAIIADGRKHADIARDFGVSVPTISDIKRGKSWKHLSRADQSRAA
ncbi:hypothetical protein FHR71_005647 [Methylobacterium sp. RAS18]|nr:hypothetical protein [Methylobacterium sp. RAS18]